MATTCYASVRGSALRVTGLDSRGRVPALIQYAASKSVTAVRVNETTESGSNQMLRNDDTEETRLLFIQNTVPIRNTVDIDFIRVDPGLLSLVAGVPVVANNGSLGFGEGQFGYGPFGYSDETEEVIQGFDSQTRLPVAAFALEVWTKVAAGACPETGLPYYGYTLFPFLKGGRLSGFQFSNGRVSFNLVGAQTRKASGWGVGPHDLEGPYERMTSEVSRNLSWRQFLTTAVPPTETCGIIETTDIIEGGTASMTTSDVIDGGTAAVTTPWIVEGGAA